MINGINVSNPSQSFTRQEWAALGKGCDIVRQLHECNASHGRGPGHGSAGHGANEHHVAAVETDDANMTAQSSLTNEHNEHGG